MSVVLYQFPPNAGGFRASPPCVAVEAYLRLAGVEYQVVTRDPLRRSGSSVLPAVHVDPRLARIR